MHQTPRLPTRVSSGSACDRCRRQKQRVGRRWPDASRRAAVKLVNLEALDLLTLNSSATRFDHAQCASAQMQIVLPIGDHLPSM
jgi:hypothetical protein